MNVPKLRFKEFNDEWNDVKLGNFSKVLMCKRIFANQTSKNYEIPFYKIGTIGGEADTFISKELFNEYKNKYNYPKKGELLITCSGTVGKCTIFDGHDSYYQDSNIVWLDNNESIVNNKFLYFILNNVNWANLNSTTIIRIYGDDLRNLNIKYPSINEQEKIGTFLSLLDKKIELQSKKIEALNLYKKGLIDHLVSNMNIVNSKKLSQLGYTYSGLSGKSKEDFVDGNCKFITFMSVLKNNISENLFSTVKIGEKERQNKVLKGDLFFTGSSETKEEVGMVSTLNYDFDNLYLNSFCFGFRLNLLDEINNNFLCNLLLSSKYRKIISNLGQGFTRVNISKKELLDIDIEYPDYDDQLRITNTLNNMYSKIKLEEEKLSKLESLKKGLMQNMFV